MGGDSSITEKIIIYESCVDIFDRPAIMKLKSLMERNDVNEYERTLYNP